MDSKVVILWVILGNAEKVLRKGIAKRYCEKVLRKGGIPMQAEVPRGSLQASRWYHFPSKHCERVLRKGGIPMMASRRYHFPSKHCRKVLRTGGIPMQAV
jgi:hypothetical protein